MLDAALGQHLAEKFGSLDGDGTNQHRLSLLVGSHYIVDNCLEFFFFRLVYSILVVDTRNRTVGRDCDRIHAVRITELLLLGQRSTGHTCFLAELIEEVLESDSCQSLALAAYIDMLLRLDCLVQAIGITAARHDTSGKLIDNEYLVIFYHVVLIAEH